MLECWNFRDDIQKNEATGPKSHGSEVAKLGLDPVTWDHWSCTVSSLLSFLTCLCSMTGSRKRKRVSAQSHEAATKLPFSDPSPSSTPAVWKTLRPFGRLSAANKTHGLNWNSGPNLINPLRSGKALKCYEPQVPHLEKGLSELLPCTGVCEDVHDSLVYHNKYGK